METINTTHYIGMAGLHGYLPATCDVYDSVKSAAESLASIHELGKNRNRGHVFPQPETKGQKNGDR